jgi:hypothetical protein
MTVTVQLMSADHYSFPIFEGYRIRNLKNDIAETFRIRDIERVVIFTDENEEVEDLDLVEEGSFFRIFISDPPTVKIVYENEDFLLYFNEKLMDIESYQECVKNGFGFQYKDIAVPDRPFILEVDSSVRNNAYRHMIRIFYNEWLQEEDDYEDLYGETTSFEYYYLSKISNNDNNEDENEDDEDDNYEYEEDEDENEEIEDILKRTKSSDHLYTYLDKFLPRKINKYDSWLRPLKIIRIDYL